MNKKVYITESQFRQFVICEEDKSQLLEDTLRGKKTPESLMNTIVDALKKGFTAGMIMGALLNTYNLGPEKAEKYLIRASRIVNMQKSRQEKEWTLVADDVFATVYNADPKQCNKDIGHTASMFRLDLDNVLSHKIIAMERTMMQKYGLKYGDVVKIEGTDKWDGIWQIQDTMNKRFKGQNKIDILVPKSKGLGQWENIKLYRLNNPENVEKYKKDMAPQLSKSEFKIQQDKLNSGKGIA